MKKDRRRHRRSIFSRLVTSYVVFLVGTLVIYLVAAVIMISYLGNGDMDNASPQSVIKSDGTINDLEALKRFGGWVEEIDDSGNVVNVIGEKKTDKYNYSYGEVASLVDLGYVTYSGSGVTISQIEQGTVKKYAACARYAGKPKKIFLVFYPSDMVTYKLTYLVTNGEGNKNLIFFLGFLGIFIAEVVGISIYLKKHIDKPLKHLMNGMDEVSEGKRDVVLDYRTDKEFEDIRDRFNLMAKKLKESEEEKHKVEQSRNRMLLELAHDLKNPVASIKSSTIALEEGLVSEEKIADYYKTIEMKAERISNLAEDMNTSLKMESDDYKLSLEKADVCEVIRRICAEFYEEITVNGKDFNIDIPDETLWANIDVKLFGRVISNLLNNANRYNEAGNEISVRASGDKEKISIDVMDDGAPIAEDFIPRLFEAFSRGDTTRKTDGGTGLGLALSRKIIGKHSGSLDYMRSEGLNCFSISIPAFLQI